MSWITYMVVKSIKRRRERKRREREASSETTPSTSEALVLSPFAHVLGQDVESRIGLEPALFNLESTAEATGNFSDANKLGQGGYGPVYKGRLPDGRVIAVKRLSAHSGQGVEEFKNEVELISRVQHKNLVRLLGCCVERGEKLLLYEFMPNSSLDAFIFDATKQGLLDWDKRYNIIEGVARGLLYLHRDSRLKIIHRDLKAGNILLDAQFNPKISDFGMARIFSEEQIRYTTKRVVGTIGYMAPEYAMEGRISEKSDVFSYGVVLLEMISGERNNYFIDDDQALNLLGHAWTLWKKNRILELIDPSLGDALPYPEVIKCIKVGLLCVQEYAVDRPTMSMVVSMLSGDMTLPAPKPAAFFGGRGSFYSGSSLDSNETRVLGCDKSVGAT